MLSSRHKNETHTWLPCTAADQPHTDALQALVMAPHALLHELQVCETITTGPYRVQCSLASRPIRMAGPTLHLPLSLEGMGRERL